MRGRKPSTGTIADQAADWLNTAPESLAAAVADVPIAEPAWMMTAAPDWALGAAALAADKWQELAPQMQALGTLGPENAPALEVLCVQYARWRLAEAQVAKHGPIIRAAVTGVPMHNPFLSVANQAADRFVKLAAEMGLTPAMRGRVTKRALKSATKLARAALPM